MGNRVLTSSCICGAVQLELTGEPVVMGICHCESCTRWLGAPIHGSALWSTDDVAFVVGEDNLVTFKRTPETGSHRKFCKSCGSPVRVDHPNVNFTDIPAVSVDNLVFEPSMHTHYAEKVISIRDGQPKYKGFHPMVGGTDELMAE